MRSLPNIERSAFRRGEWVGYSHGVWSITGCSGLWTASHRQAAFPVLRSPTLEALSDELARFVPPYMAARDAAASSLAAQGVPLVECDCLLHHIVMGHRGREHVLSAQFMVDAALAMRAEELERTGALIPASLY